MSDVVTPLVDAAKLAAPGSIKVWSASTDSGSRLSRTSRTMWESMACGVGSPRPLTTLTVACRSVDCFCQPTQVTGLASVSMNSSLAVG